jgi:flagellar basal-body rod protein FlgB
VVEIQRDFLSDLTSSVLAKGLDFAGIRHKVIADNLANVETPGFTRSDVSFEAQLKSALASGNPDDAVKSLEGLEPDVQPDVTSPSRPDGNNVSVDKEMAAMTENNLEYEALVQLMDLKFSMLRSAISEGKR